MRYPWKPVAIMLLAYALLALVLLAGPVHSYEVTGPEPTAGTGGRKVEGVWWDPDAWSAIYMPDSAVACRWEGTNLRCIPVPPGSVLLIPQAAK